MSECEGGNEKRLAIEFWVNRLADVHLRCLFSDEANETRPLLRFPISEVYVVCSDRRTVRMGAMVVVVVMRWEAHHYMCTTPSRGFP